METNDLHGSSAYGVKKLKIKRRNFINKYRDIVKDGATFAYGIIIICFPCGGNGYSENYT